MKTSIQLFCSAAIICLFPVACAPVNGLSTSYSKLSEAASEDAKLRLQAAKAVVTGAQTTQDTMTFIGAPAAQRCSNIADEQLKVTEARLVAFKALDNYLEIMTERMKGVQTFSANLDKTEALIIEGNQLAGGVVSPALLTAIAGLSKAGMTMIQNSRQLQIEQQIREIAFKNDKHVKEVVNDLIAGLKVLDASRNTSLKAWEECEFQLVKWIRDRKDYTTIELETRYRAFISTRNAISALSGKPIGKDDPINKVIEIHGKLAGRNALTREEMMAAVEELLARVKAFEAARVEADAKLKEAIAQLEL